MRKRIGMNRKVNQEITSVTKEGFDGIFYPTKQQDRAIIFVSGSEGGIKTGKKMGSYYQELGYATLAIGLFHTKHTNKSLSKVPIEYMRRAVAWLRKRGYNKIILDGISKGSEYVLYSAVVISDITGVIARVPSYFISEGLNHNMPSGDSCWSDQGKELAYTPYKNRKINKIKMLLSEKQLSLLDMNKDKDVMKESIIPVEKIHGNVLLMATKADTIWPSNLYMEHLIQRFFEKSFPFELKNLSFEYVSHMLLPVSTKKSLWFLRILFRSERLYPKECAQERKKMEQVTLQFLKKTFL